MPTGIDHIVITTNEPEISIQVNICPVSGQVPSICKFGFVGCFVVPVCSHHGGPAGLEGDQTNLPDFLNGLKCFCINNGCCNSRKSFSHRARLDLHAGKVREHYGAGFCLPISVQKWFSKYFFRPDYRFGVQRLAYTCQMPQRRQIVFFHNLVAGFH